MSPANAMPKIQSFDDLLDRAKQAQRAMRDLNLTLIETHDRVELAKLDHAIDALSQLNQDAEPEPSSEPSSGLSSEAGSPAIVAGSTAESTAIVPSAERATASQPSDREPAEQAAAPLKSSVPGAAQRLPGAPSTEPAVIAGQKRPAGASAASRPPQTVSGPVATRPATPKPVVTPTTAPGTFAEQISKGTYTRRLRRVFVTGAGQGMVPLQEMPHRHGLPSFDNCLAPDDSPVNGAFGIFVSQSAVFAAVLRRPFVDNEWQVIESIHCRQQRDIVDAVADLMRRPSFTIQDPL